MGAVAAQCCRRRELAALERTAAEWTAYSDREHMYVPPSSAADRRHRPSTTSMTDEELMRYVQDEYRPRAAEAASRELERRRSHQ